ncbi:MAG: TolC family protein [Acidobacteriota bacterium]
MKLVLPMLLLAPLCCGAQVLTLDAAVALAVKENRGVQLSAIDLAKAGEVVAQARTRRLPKIEANVLAGQTLVPMEFAIPMGALGVFAATGPIPAHNATVTTPRTFSGLVNLSMAQPLTQLVKVGLATRDARVGEELARETLHEQQRNTVLRVKDTYYQVAQAQAQISGAKASLAYLIELSALVDRQFAEQTVLQSDVLTMKGQVLQQQYQVLVLENALASSKETLNHLLGRDLRTDFAVEEQPVPGADDLDLAAARANAIAQRSEIRMAGLQTKKADIEIRRQRAEYLPDISVQLSYLSLSHVSFVPKQSVSAALLLQWQPFDWGLTRHKIAELEGGSRQAALSVEDARQRVDLDVNATFRSLTESRAQLATQAAIQETEREKLRVLTHQYQQQAVLLADLLRQQAAVAQASNQYQQALARLWSATAGFDHAIGRD